MSIRIRFPQHHRDKEPPMSPIPSLKRARLAAIAVAAGLALSLPACSGGSTSLQQAPAGTAGANLPTVRLAMVSSLDNAPFLYAQEHGLFEKEGIKVEFVGAADGGPAIVTGVVNGTYDVGSAAPLPILVAVSKGSPLTILTDISKISRDKQGSSMLLVRDDSSIHTYADLVGKTVATNALTSTGTLADKIAVANAGGDPQSMTFTVLPFKTGVQAVIQKQVDAALTIEPIGTEALMAGGVRSIGDPMDDALPANSPYGVLFTSNKAARDKHAALLAFDRAVKAAIHAIQPDEALQRTMAHENSGVPEAVAAKVVLPNYAGDALDVPALQAYADAAAKYGFLAGPMDVSKIVISP